MLQMNRAWTLFALLLLLAVGLAASASWIQAATTSPRVPAQSSGGGYTALFLGVPGENNNYPIEAGEGVVQALYGSLVGLTAAGSQLWSQHDPAIGDEASQGDRFGEALAVGDFDGDGFADLALGVRGEDLLGVEEAGAVNVLYGDEGGLGAAGSEFWHQGLQNLLDTAETGDQFGSSLAVGDFDQDGYDDLAIGVPYEDVGSAVNAGAVHVLYGSPDGLSGEDDQVWHQDVPFIAGTAGDNDTFGTSLESGDFNGDGYDDLAIGVPFEDTTLRLNAGAVNVLYGSGSGLGAYGNDLWDQSATGDEFGAGDDFYFGAALAAGDLDGDGRDDLVVGIPGADDLDGPKASGAVNILRGSFFGLETMSNPRWSQGTVGILDDPEDNDYFGQALVVADINGDGANDLVVGVPGESSDGSEATGALHVILGAEGGLTVVGDQFWHQDSPGILDDAESHDRFGRPLAACDLNSDGYADLAVGVRGEEIAGNLIAGAVNVLYGARNGLTERGNQFWHQDSSGVPDDAEERDYFGYSLACVSQGGGPVYLPLLTRP